MSKTVQELLTEKTEAKANAEEMARQKAMRQAEADRKKLEAVFQSVENDLDGLEWKKLDHQGQYRVRHKGYNVYIEIRWHQDTVKYADDCPEEDIWTIKIGVGTRAVNCPECYLTQDGFAESFSDILLSLG